MRGLIGAAVKGVLETVKIIIPRPGKRSAGDEGLEEDLDELRPMTMKSIGKTNWFSGPPSAADVFTERTDAITTNTRAAAAGTPAEPEPGPKRKLKPKRKRELLKEWRRLKKELDRIEQK